MALARLSFPVISGNPGPSRRTLDSKHALECFPNERWHEGRSLLIWTEQDAAFFSVSFFAFLEDVKVVGWGGGVVPGVGPCRRHHPAYSAHTHTSLRNPSWKLSANFCLFSSSGRWRKREARDETADVLQMRRLVFDHHFPSHTLNPMLVTLTFSSPFYLFFFLKPNQGRSFLFYTPPYHYKSCLCVLSSRHKSASISFRSCLVDLSALLFPLLKRCKR